MRWAGLCKIEGPQRESSGKRCVPQFRHRRFPFPELPCLELTLLDLLRQLDSANGDCRVVESFESQHRPNPQFESPVVLFDEIVQVLARSHFYSARQFAGLLHFPHGAMRCGIGVQRDLGGCAPVLYRITEKGLGSVDITVSAQEEIVGPAGLVHGPIQIDPTAPDLYICLVHPPESPNWTSISIPTLLEFWQVMPDAAQNRGVRQRDAPIRHHDHQVSKAQLEARVPADTQDDDLSIEMSSLEH